MLCQIHGCVVDRVKQRGPGHVASWRHYSRTTLGLFQWARGNSTVRVLAKPISDCGMVVSKGLQGPLIIQADLLLISHQGLGSV